MGNEGKSKSERSMLETVADSVIDDICGEFLDASVIEQYVEDLVAENPQIYNCLTRFSNHLLGNISRKIIEAGAITYQLFDENMSAQRVDKVVISSEFMNSFYSMIVRRSSTIKPSCSVMFESLKRNHSKVVVAIRRLGYNIEDTEIRAGVCIIYGLLESYMQTQKLMREIDTERLYTGPCPDSSSGKNSKPASDSL